MVVRVRLFAGLRERAGTGALEIEVEDSATVGDVWPALGLGDEPLGLLYARNRAYVERTEALVPGDEVAVIPPVSGGDFRLSAEPLSVDAAVDEVRDDAAGAIATFIGTTRARSRGREVIHLEYEAYEGMAEQVMADLAAQLGERHELCKVAIHHRVGSRRHRRDERRHRRLGGASRCRARGVQGRDRRAEGVRATLEEGDVRGR